MRRYAVEWAMKSWKKFLIENKNMIMKSFSNSGLLLPLDGSSDYKLDNIRE